MSIARLALPFAIVASACVGARGEPPAECTAGEPVRVAPGDVAAITHEPAGSARVTGTVVTVDGVEDGLVLVLDDGEIVHRFGLGSPANAPFGVGTTVTAVFEETRDGGSFRTDLFVYDAAGAPWMAFVRASGDHDVRAVVEETAARLGGETSARPSCLTAGGACGRRGARWELVYPGGDPGHGEPLADGGRLTFNAWQLEDDDTAAWSGAPTCDTSPRASISLEGTRWAPPPPEPPPCTAPAALPLGSFGLPVGAPAIVHTPEGALEATANVIAIETSPVAFVLDVGGVEHRIEVPLAADVPELAPGSTVVVELQPGARAGSSGSRETLILRAPAGEVLAYYARARGWGWLESSAEIGELFALPTALAAVCRVDSGGQCGRGIVVRELLVGGTSIGEGEAQVVDGDLRVRVHGLSDDADSWQDADVCAIAPFVADAVDAVRLP